MSSTVFWSWRTKFAKSPLHANCTVPYFRYSVIRSSAHMITSRTRRSSGSARFLFNHLSTSGSLLDMVETKNRRAARPPVETLLRSALRLAEQAERRSLGIREDREPASREVLGAEHLSGAEVDRLVVRLVDVVGHEVDLPVGRDLFRHHRVHLHGAGDALAVVLELGVVTLALAHGAHLLRPAEDLLVESLGLVDAARVELGPAICAGLAHHLCAEHLLGLPGGDKG